MLTENLQRTSVTEAISDTFDGEHPCSMCKAIKQGRAEEEQPDQQPVKPGLKLELGAVPQTAIFTRTQAREWVPSADLQSDSIREGPPKPRPRSVSATVLS